MSLPLPPTVGVVVVEHCHWHTQDAVLPILLCHAKNHVLYRTRDVISIVHSVYFINIRSEERGANKTFLLKQLNILYILKMMIMQVCTDKVYTIPSHRICQSKDDCEYENEAEKQHIH